MVQEPVGSRLDPGIRIRGRRGASRTGIWPNARYGQRPCHTHRLKVHRPNRAPDLRLIMALLWLLRHLLSRVTGPRALTVLHSASQPASPAVRLRSLLPAAVWTFVFLPGRPTQKSTLTQKYCSGLSLSRTMLWLRPRVYPNFGVPNPPRLRNTTTQRCCSAQIGTFLSDYWHLFLIMGQGIAPICPTPWVRTSSTASWGRGLDPLLLSHGASPGFSGRSIRRVSSGNLPPTKSSN